MRFCTSALRFGVPVAIESHDLHRGIAWLAALMLAVLPFAARAQDDDLPGRVGRIAEFAGQLVLSPQDRPTEWEPIGINYPITSGDNLWVSSDGRAEVDYGGGQFRIAGDTSVHVSRLDDRQLALFMAQGRLIVRIRSLDPGDAMRVDTPNTQVTLTRPGLYRIEVAPDREATLLTVREGEAQVALAYGAQQSLPGQTVTVVGTNAVNADIRNSIGVDGFDTWSADRDRRYERGRSTAYVSREMVGYADLDEHGSWQSYPDYGNVWFPTTVAPGWAPYSDGYWTNVGGWGPTWVDNAPWGYAPFHYGRWARVGARWGWVPGGYVARPIWAPALVAWVGGPGWGLSVRQGAPVYGWVPLGWGDAYHPNWRRCSYNCWAHYNRPYAVNVTVRPTAPPARYANIAVPGALSAVAAPALVGRKPITKERVDVPASLAASAPVMTSVPPVAQAPRPAPRAGRGNASPPPGASAHVRAPRPEPAGPGAVSRPTMPATPAPGVAAGAPSVGGTPPASVPAARPGLGTAPDAPPDTAGTSRPGGGDAASGPKTPPAGRVPPPTLPPPSLQGQAPPVAAPGSSGTVPSTGPSPRESGWAQPPKAPRPPDPTAPATSPQREPGRAQPPQVPRPPDPTVPATSPQREPGRAQPPQVPRPPDPAVPPTSPRREPGAVQVPAQTNDSARQMRREPPRTRETPVPPTASPSAPPAPSGGAHSTSGAPRLPPPGRAAPPASPGLSGAAGSAVPAAPPAGARPAPPAGGQPAPASAKGTRPPEKPAPDATPAGTGAVK